MDCDNRVIFCKILCKECNHIGDEMNCPHHSITCGGRAIPTFKEYLKIIETKFEERKKIFNCRHKNYVKGFLRVFNKFKDVMGYTDDTPINVVNKKTIQEFCIKLMSEGNNLQHPSFENKKCTLNTAKSYVDVLKTIFGNWIRCELQNEWFVPAFEQPDILRGVQYPRYQEKSSTIKTKVAIWYRSLLNRGRGIFKNSDRLFVMFMYKYAMRNGDVTKLKYSNIVNENGYYRLIYTPHKTSGSSKTVVKVFLSTMDYYDLMEYKQLNKHTDDDYIFGGGGLTAKMGRLNRELRAIGFTGSKGLYELRKLCIDTILKSKGALHAAAISGDNYDTVEYFYSDPRSLSDLNSLSDDDYLKR